MNPFSRMPQDLDEAHEEVRGFILLEVLVVVSLVATSWLASETSYHQLVLRMGHMQSKKDEIKKELDRHEITLFNAQQSQSRIPKGDLIESIGVSRRSRPITHSSGAAHQK